MTEESSGEVNFTLKGGTTLNAPTFLNKFVSKMLENIFKLDYTIHILFLTLYFNLHNISFVSST